MGINRELFRRIDDDEAAFVLAGKMSGDDVKGLRLASRAGYHWIGGLTIWPKLYASLEAFGPLIRASETKSYVIDDARIARLLEFSVASLAGEDGLGRGRIAPAAKMVMPLWMPRSWRMIWKGYQDVLVSGLYKNQKGRWIKKVAAHNQRLERRMLEAAEAGPLRKIIEKRGGRTPEGRLTYLRLLRSHRLRDKEMRIPDEDDLGDLWPLSHDNYARVRIEAVKILGKMLRDSFSCETKRETRDGIEDLLQLKRYDIHPSVHASG